VTRLAGALLALTAGLGLLEAALPSAAHVPAGAHGAFGVVGALLLILVAKLLGAAGLQRPEDRDE
jgi:hypothetical protein